MKDPTLWILARSSGLLAYACLTASMLLGLLVKARPFRSLSRATVTDLHRFVALLALAAVVVHGSALVLDATAPLPVLALLLPGLSPYRPLWTACGVVAAELMLVIIASFPLRRLLGAKAWRRLHWATYGVYGLAAVHGAASGTDSSRPWAMAFYGVTLGSVAAAMVWRFLIPPPRRVPSAASRPQPLQSTPEGARP